MQIHHKNPPQKISSPPQFVFLTKEQADSCSTLILEANRDTFPHLAHGAMSEQQFLQQNTNIILQCFQAQQKYNLQHKTNIKFCYGLKINGEIVAIMLAIELKQFYQTIQQSMKVNQFLAQFKHLKIQEISSGTAVYYTRLSVKPQIKGRGLGKRLLYQASKYLKGEGYQYSIMGSIAKPSFQMFTKLGCKIQRHQQAIRPTFTYQMYIFKAVFQQLVQKISLQSVLQY